ATIAEWRDTTWQFSFDELEFNEGDLAIDLIKGKLPGYSGRVDRESIAISDTCFSVSDSSNPSGSATVIEQRVCAQATGTADELNGNITFDDVPLMFLKPILPATVGLTGSLDGTISLGWDIATSTPRAKVLLNTSAADLQSTNNQGETRTVLHFEPGKVNANWTDDALFAVVELPLAGSAGFNATASIAPGKGGEFASRGIEANVIARFDDLDWMADFLQGVTQLSGNLESNLQISGVMSRPVLDGNLSLKKGKAVLPGPGLTLRELDVNIVGAGNDGLVLTGSVKSGGGTLNLAGQVNGIGSNIQGQMSFSGQRVLILNTPAAEIYASPIINAELQQLHLNLSGEVSIDKANIKLTSLPQTAATVSSDQIIVVKDAPEAEPASRFDVTTQLHLLLNDAVSFSGFGLEATFGGDLNLVDLPGKPTTGTGDINVLAGQYRAYGQNLTIETGKLLFVGGPIDQPGIDVRAVRQVTADIKVGALARGNLRAPEFSIFSEPHMNQSDQLAYLFLGRPLSTSSSGESSVLSRAALAMGIKGGNYLTEQFGSKLRVDKIGIETPGTNANEQAALVVGKYLSPKLFVSYGIGVIDAVSTLKIEYLLSSRWRVSSKSSVDQSGLDLNYVLER
ncbi:MAG: translocation and assembly module TamB, partial [Granulosicoccus sp.]